MDNIHMGQFKVFHDYGYPFLYGFSISPIKGEWVYLKTLPGKWKKSFDMTPEEQEVNDFEHHAARAFFACAWADLADECNADAWPAGAEIMDYMPADVDPAAVHAARTLRMDIERINGASIFDLMAIVEGEGDGDRPNTVEYFGHYAAMQAMGHGVGLRDAFGADVADKIKTPYVEFSSASLEKDYFTVQGE